jgi:heme/copper-type cytochrome/quinol oxidase subunit 3
MSRYLQTIECGLTGRTLRTTIILYLSGLLGLSPIALMVWNVSDVHVVFSITPALVALFVVGQYFAVYFFRRKASKLLVVSSFRFSDQVIDRKDFVLATSEDSISA